MTIKKATIPQVAIILGYGGVSPFFGLACLSIIFDENFFTTALITYAAVIVSFLGGVHWGVAISSFPKKKTTTELTTSLCISITPAIISWATLLIQNVTMAITILSGAFACQLAIDMIATKNGDLPSWYNALRIPLTIIAITCLIITCVF
jgi:hypothetical protein